MGNIAGEWFGENLLRSFPEKTDAERLQIERKFYRYLSDYMLEDLKLLHMSAEELCARMTYKNTEQYLNQLKSMEVL